MNDPPSLQEGGTQDNNPLIYTQHQPTFQSDSSSRNPKKCYGMPLTQQPGPAYWLTRVLQINGSWYYHYGNSYPEGLPDSIGWTPMIWDYHGDVTTLNSDLTVLNYQKSLGLVNSLLGFNEPDGSTQADMTVQEALDIWPKLMSLGVPLGSPATTGPTVQWMKNFMSSVAALGYRVDFIAVHWYGAPDSAAFINVLKQTYALYHRPIWITEFAVADWSAKSIEDNPYSPKQVLAFMQKVLPALDSLNFVEKYFWHNTPYNKPGAWSSALFDSTYALTELGQYYAQYQYSGPLPLVPVPVSPIASMSEILRKATLTWNSSTFGLTYRIQIANDSMVVSDGSFEANTVVFDTTLADTSVQLSQPLDSSTTYYWHVCAIDVGGASDYSPTYSFKTGKVIALPSIPVTVSPVPLQTGVPRNATLIWRSALYADRYALQIATDRQLYTSGDSTGMFKVANVVLDTTVTDTSVHSLGPLSANTAYYWHVRALNAAGTSSFSTTAGFLTSTVIAAIHESNGIPKKFALFQNYPNPFNPMTVIRYDVPEISQVTIKVYDALGREVMTLVDARHEPGEYTVEFDGSKFASGVYLVGMSVDNYTKIQKMVLVK